MIKQLIVFSSLLVGTGSAGTAMYLQQNPHALSKGERVNLETYLYSARPDPNTAPAKPAPKARVEDAEPMVVGLPGVVVRRPRPAVVPVVAPSVPELAPADTAAPSPETPRELKPCSKFREIGPMNVDDGVPTGARGVRDLC